ncbi:sigma-70 family RNA polymerase sigma factor [soil metagenome]
MDQEPTTMALLREWHGGSNARERLLTRLHPDLMQIAAARLRRERNSSLSTGDLINDAVMRLIQIESLSANDRAHFIALASMMMRRILVDHARAKNSDKRKHVKIELRTNADGDQRVDLASLDSALVRLRVLDETLMELVEMRYFGGMTTADIAEVSGLSEATVKRKWQVARAWLADALANPIDHDG